MSMVLIVGTSSSAHSDALSDTTNAKSSSGLNFTSSNWKLPTFSSWWNGSSGTANWLGLADHLSDYGLSVKCVFRDVYYGEVSGGLPNQPMSNFIEQIKLRATYDFGKVFALDGLTLTSGWRYRNVAGNNPAYAAGAYGTTSWSPSDMSSGFGLRMQSQMLQYSNSLVMINLGMENPYDQFLQQPLSKEFQNNMINSAKGIGMPQGSGIPVVGGAGGYSTPYNSVSNLPRSYGAPGAGWSSSYLAWGGTLNVKPVKDFYIQSGLYEAVAGDTGVSPSQFTVTGVYPYTSVPQSYLGTMKYNGEVVPLVGGNGQIIPGASQNIGWVAAYQNNHGFTFGGAPGNNFPAALVNAKPTTGVTSGTYNATGNGSTAGAATYKNSQGQTVSAPAFYASSPYNQGGVGGNWSGNGLFNMNEIGWTPKFGADKLEGHYAIGSYIWGLPNYSYSQTTYYATVYNPTTGNVATAAYSKKPFASQYNGCAFGLYLQGDQMLYRYHPNSEHSAKKPVPHSFSDRGLYMFSEANFTPPQNNAMPLYFQIGLVYKGLLNCRPKDSMGIVVGSGFYSSCLNSYTQSQNQAYENAVTSAYNATVPNGPTQAQTVSVTGKYGGNYNNYYQYLPNYTSTQVVEAFYTIQINKWAFFKPYAQCIVNPAGNGTVGTDWILGTELNVAL